MAIDLYDGSDIIYTLLTDLGIKMDTNDTTENSSKDLDERYVDKPFIPQVRTNTLSDDVDNTMTSIENAKYASFEFLDLKTDRDIEVYYYNYRSQKEEPKEDFIDNRVYHSPIETQIYTQAEEGAPDSINVVNNVKENPVGKVTENAVNSVSGQSGAPVTYQGKSPWSPAFKNYAFSITTIDKVAEDLSVTADLKSKMPYLEKDLEKAGIDKEEFDGIIELCNKADPTGNNATYTQWILRQYIKNNFKGEEDVEKFKDTLQNFTKLKNSKKIQPADLNQYKTFEELSQKVEETLQESGGYTSERSKEKGLAESGIKKIDQDGDIELYLVTTPEAAAKEFRNTGWCVKDPEYFKDYAELDGNFYYFKKDGKPFLLLHKEDFKNVYDRDPIEEEEKEVANLVAKHNLPFLYDFLLDGMFSKDSPYYEKVIKNLVEDERKDYSYGLLANKRVTPDSPYYDKLMEKVVVNDDYACSLLAKGIIPEDSPYYKKVLEKFLEDSNSAYFLLKHGITEDFPYYDKVLEKVLEDSDGAYSLLDYKIITEDSKYYEKVLEKATENVVYSYVLIVNKRITEDSPYFEKVLEKVLEDSYIAPKLLDNKIITKDSPYYEKVKDKCGYADSEQQNNLDNSSNDESTNDDTNKESAFEFTYINKVADFVQEFNRQDELTDEQTNKFVNHLPVTEVNKDYRDDLKEKAKQTGKVITFIPKSLNYPYIEDEMAGNKLFYGDMDWMEMSDLSEM